MERVKEKSWINPVIKYGYCVGCGACAGLEKPRYEMIVTPFGTLEARKSNENKMNEEKGTGSVCPFSDMALDEDFLSSELFKDLSIHEKLGRFIQTYAGYVLKGSFRKMGSSGGMGTWILEQLLVQGYVDAVVHVGNIKNQGNGLIYGYKISRTLEELRQGAKSKYYPVTLADVFIQVRENPGRYAFTGIPCFIKAIRLVSRKDPSFGKSVKYCIGLICGHMKSSGFAEFLAWQMDIKPDNLKYFDFRVKLKNKSANKYGVLAAGYVNGKYIERTAAMDNLFGNDWGMGLFKVKACDYCDDVVAETADVTVGDAWLPKYIKKTGGTNIIISRHKTIEDIISNGVNSSEIWLEEIKPSDVIKSQGSGYSHRREGLSYRLWLADSKKLWRPKKRILPEIGIHGKIFEKRHRLRMDLAKKSHEALLEAKKYNNIAVFFDRILPISKEYLDLSHAPYKRFLVRLERKIIGALPRKKAKS